MNQVHPVIQRNEFLNRLSELKKFIVSHDLDALIVFSCPRAHIWSQTGHVGYISNWSDRDHVSNAMVIVPLEGNPVFLISGLPYLTRKVQEFSWIAEARAGAAEDPRASALPGLARTFGTEVREILSERGLMDKKIGVVGVEAMPVPVYQSFVEALSPTTIEFPDDIVAELRCQKSTGEISLMRESARLSDLGFMTLLQTVKPGMWGYEVIAEMERAVRAQRADYAQFWMASGVREQLSIICAGQDTVGLST